MNLPIPILLMETVQQTQNPGLWGSFVNFLKGILEGLYTITSKIPEPFGGYGLAIILFTIIFRAALLPLDLKSKKANQKIAEIQPELNEINKKYKNDPEKRNQKTLELYQKHKINPLGGCLPVLLTLPLMFAMLTALNKIAAENIAKEAVERFLWIKNVWSPDSPFKDVLNKSIPMLSQGFNGLFILPILAGVTSYYQIKLSQPSGDNQQMKGFNIMMPLMSVWFCTMYTSAFAIYWVTANLFQIGQYFVIKRLNPPVKEGEAK